MDVRLKSKITIGGFSFAGVHEVKIKKSLHSYLQTAFITIPATSVVLRKDGTIDPVTDTAKRFKVGDAVSVFLGYDDDLKEEFRGFVKRLAPNTPLVIECEGYSYQLRQNTITKSWSKTTVKEVLSEAVKNTDISLVVANDMSLVNIVCNNKTGADLVDFVKKASHDALNAFFIEPDKLWVGLAYLPKGEQIEGGFSLSTVKLKIGFNTILEKGDHGLKQKIPNTEVTINFKNRAQKRTKDAPLKPEEVGKVKHWLAQNIGSADDLAKMKAALEFQANYTGWEGKVPTFLQPYTRPGDKVILENPRFPDQNGTFLLESVEVVFGMNGARRFNELGPKIST